MCGRVKTPEEWSEIKAANKIKWGVYRDSGRHYNVPPTPVIDVIRYDAGRGGNGIEQTFRNAWKAGRRCLVPIDNFYEWRKPDMQPFAIAMANRSAMMLAGLWETWKPKDGSEPVRSFTIITVGARGVLADLHDRAPAIIGPENWDTWLGSEESSNDDLIAMLIPIAAERLTMWPVSRALGNVKNDGPELVDRVHLP